MSSFVISTFFLHICRGSDTDLSGTPSCLAGHKLANKSRTVTRRTLCFSVIRETQITDPYCKSANVFGLKEIPQSYKLLSAAQPSITEAQSVRNSQNSFPFQLFVYHCIFWRCEAFVVLK